MEVLLKNTTEITGLPKKIHVSSLEFEDSTAATISVQEVEGKSVFERVSVNIKVTRKWSLSLWQLEKEARYHCL